jgi:hypothetical protein
MADSSLIKKLRIKRGDRAAILNAPAEYLQLIGDLSPDAKIETVVAPSLDFVQLFVKTSQELDNQVPSILNALKKGGLFWICYPKGGSKIKTDLNRDILWATMGKFSMAGVSLISIDNVWSAMRFRPTDEVGK